MGLMTDVGDLAAIVQRLEGRRPLQDTDPRADLEHELSDCLWVLLVLAERYGVNLGSAFTQTMTGIETWIDSKAEGASRPGFRDCVAARDAETKRD